jgi:hypothetical protein
MAAALIVVRRWARALLWLDRGMVRFLLWLLRPVRLLIVTVYRPLGLWFGLGPRCAADRSPTLGSGKDCSGSLMIAR